MFQDIKNTVGRWGAIATAALALAGCSRNGPETAPAKEPLSLTNTSLPAAPRISPDPRIIAVLKDQKLPAQVLQALKNPDVQSTLHRIATSAENPESYVRNAPYASQESVVVLQHLLNMGRGAAITNALNYAAQREQTARQMHASDAPRAERYRQEAEGMRRYATRAPGALKLDGDYGVASHNLRGFFTMVYNMTSGGQFPHVQVDKGANNTAIGPKTLNLLFRNDPGLGYLLLADPATYRVSLDSPTNGQAATNGVGKALHGK